MEISEQDIYFLNLIQKTPHVEILANQLRKKGFPFIEVKQRGTRYQKCRRLYDALHKECFSYEEARAERLKKVFHDTGNGVAGELLYSFRDPAESSILNQLLQSPEEILKMLVAASKNIKFSTLSMGKIFRSAKIGNASKLDNSLKAVATKCAGFEGVNDLKDLSEMDLDSYRVMLGIFLKKRDWGDKTILHVAIDGNSPECLDIVLRYAQEAHNKEDLLDMKDTFGSTALHHAIKKKYKKMTRKLIIEGADLFLRNNVEEFPLQLIFQFLPSMAPFLMDRAVTISGEVWSCCDPFFLNIDFGILNTFVDFKVVQESRLKPLRLNGRFSLRKKQSKKQAKEVTIKINVEPEESSDFELELDSLRRNDGQESEQFESDFDCVDGFDLAEEKSKAYGNGKKEMTILAHLVYNESKACLDILNHPVTQTFLDLKWQRMRAHLLFFNTSLRIVVYGLYIILLLHIYFLECPHSLAEECKWTRWTRALLYTVILLILVFLIQEIFKATRLERYRYPGVRAWARITFFLIAIGTSIPPLFQRRLYSFQYPAATVGILLASSHILQVIGNSNCDFCIHSIYIHVYSKVMLRFLSVMATFSPLIFSFAVAFNIIYPKTEQFATFWRSFFRLTIMLQGEFDYEDKQTLNDGNKELVKNEGWIFWSGQILFGTFGCVLTLVLIDVFLGYTVSDIKELKTQAEFVSRCNQIKQMFVAEEIFNYFTTERGTKKLMGKTMPRKDEFTVVPVKKKNKFRNDVVVSFEEIPETRRAEFRTILIEPS